MNELDIWPIPFQSNVSETIPAHAVMQCVGHTIFDGEVCLVMGKPNAYSSQYNCFINGRVPVSVGGYGHCSNAMLPVVARYEGSSPDFNALMGPIPNSWFLRAFVGGFIARHSGPLENSSNLVVVERAPCLAMEGKAVAACAKDATGTMYPYENGVLNEDATVSYLNRLGEIEEDADMSIEWRDNAWRASGAECEVD